MHLACAMPLGGVLLTIYTMRMDRSSPQIVLDSKRVQLEIRRRGMSVTGLAEALGVHRNTIGNYLSGKAGLPQGLSRILDALDLAPAEVLSWDRRRRRIPGLAVSDLVGALPAEVPGRRLHPLRLPGPRRCQAPLRLRPRSLQRRRAGVHPLLAAPGPGGGVERGVSADGAARRSDAGGAVLPVRGGGGRRVPGRLPCGLVRLSAKGGNPTA